MKKTISLIVLWLFLFPLCMGVYAESPEEETIFLEFKWLENEAPREALLMVPPKQVPFVLIRILSKDEELQALVGLAGKLAIDSETPEQILLECSGAKVLWGNSEAVEEVPTQAVLSTKHGAVEVGGKLAPCLVLPVTHAKEEEVLKKYTIPSSSQEIPAN